MRPKKYKPVKNLDEDTLSNDSDNETEDLALQINTDEKLLGKESVLKLRSKPGIGGRHRREWRDAISRSQDHQDATQERDNEKEMEQSIHTEIHIKQEPLDSDNS